MRLRVALAALVAVTVPATVARAGSSSVGKPPPELAANAGSWPSHNLDLANTRANLDTMIDARDVATLKKRWTFKLPYVGGYGAFTSNPIVLGGAVYLEDPDSDVFALRLATGKLLWQHDYRSVTPSGGPNGVALGYGLLYGETESSVFALDPHTGKQVWIRKLTANANEGIDMAPQLYDGKLLISTIPGSSTSFYTGGAYGIVYALDARTGKKLWSFSTVKGGATLWGDPKENDGGGLWYPPAVDSHGRVFLGTGNPGPYPLTPNDPNARSRPGPNLYTDSLVALNGATGKLLWYQQVTPHDLRDHDFQDSPVLVTVKVHGVPTEAVIGAGKSGMVVAFRAADGKRLWTLAIGKHNRYGDGPLPSKPVLYCPGSLGGVLTPMAEARGVLYVPWLDACFKGSATGLAAGGGKASGHIAAVDAATGSILWKRTFTSIDSGAATIANDVVFTSTYDGTVYALSAKTGATLWQAKAPAGVNSFPAVTKTMVIVGAGAADVGVEGAQRSARRVRAVRDALRAAFRDLAQALRDSGDRPLGDEARHSLDRRHNPGRSDPEGQRDTHRDLRLRGQRKCAGDTQRHDSHGPRFHLTHALFAVWRAHRDSPPRGRSCRHQARGDRAEKPDVDYGRWRGKDASGETGRTWGMPVKYSNAFLAMSVELAPTGASLTGALFGWWGPVALPTQARFAVVWTCELEAREFGKELTFDVSLDSPDGANELIGHVEGRSGAPMVPMGMPYGLETVFVNVQPEFRVQGAHTIHIRSGDGLECSLPLWVQST